ncbi:unnamed protein product [Spirodela intermedia]|uniref:Uncharacterized protein n=2 Tax=Spirodela intermedia TaxID=51605 RepID=A0A7I8I9X9_SPIIN|nr:unnamed protein product [Spirodela intermedia]CAA6653731.1 unnamed protein product [Spirodela intermedia]CAA7388091.1 unnamed protein product [Spirodela intermedia]
MERKGEGSAAEAGMAMVIDGRRRENKGGQEEEKRGRSSSRRGPAGSSDQPKPGRRDQTIR